MRTIFKIAKTELRDLFYSPIAWLILIIFTFQTGMLFSGTISEIVRSQSMGGKGMNLTLAIFGGQRGLFRTCICKDELLFVAGREQDASKSIFI